MDDHVVPCGKSCKRTKECWAFYMREWTRKNRERVNARRRESRAADPERLERTRTLNNVRNARYWESNRADPAFMEQRRRAVRESYQRHAEKRRAEARERGKRTRKEQPEKVRQWREASHARYRARLGDAAYRELQKQWESGYRATARAKSMQRINVLRRRARKRGAKGDCTKAQWEARYAYYGGRCWLCGEPGADSVDHVHPLARGGTHWPANLRPAHIACNSRKGVKTMPKAQSVTGPRKGPITVTKRESADKSASGAMCTSYADAMRKGSK